MALILNIETAASVCSVSLAEDGKLIGYKENTELNSHARVLTVLIQNLLKEYQLSFEQLDAIAVSEGPGSYTGLRIGVSAAKGLCYALDKPLIGVPTLLSLAQGIMQKDEQAELFMPVIDARRADVYTAIFDSSGKQIFETSCVTLNEEFEKGVSTFGKIVVGGNATNKCRELLNSPQFKYADGIECDSRWMINLSHSKYCNNEFENVAYYEPFYLKEFYSKDQRHL